VSARHLGLVLDWRAAVCGAVLGEGDKLPTTNEDAVECKDCLKIMAERHVPRTPVSQEERMRDQRRQWTIEAAAGDTDLGLIDWLKEKLGVGAPTPHKLHTPPRMEGVDGVIDGVFIFHDRFIEGNTLEVVPQSTGNVELTIEYDGSARFLTLHHSDRADLLRALLHDFHYSPERGGPADD
jgi:hypothetical protein